MNEATITGIITAANSHFKVPMYSSKTIRCCLKDPKHYLSSNLKERLEVLLMKVKNTDEQYKNKQFWKNVKSVLKAAMELLSGEKMKLKQMKPVVSKNLKKSSSSQDIRTVLKTADLQCPVPFWFAAPELFDDRTVKLADGSFSEIYQVTKSNGEERILKIIPVEGPDNGEEEQLTFKDIIAEIYTSLELSKLSNGKKNRCSAFPNIYKICVVKDSFPRHATEAWEEHARWNRTEKLNPKNYMDDQIFIILESDLGGIELDHYEVLSCRQAVSVFKQIAVALAVAEEALSFEHRDLHVNNILIKETEDEMLNFRFRNRKFCFETHGVKAMIIDFTFSRISIGDDVKYLKLDDMYYIRRTCRYKYLNHRYVYGKMEGVTQNDWKGYYPKTNVLWLKHVLENLLCQTEKIPHVSKNEQFAMVLLKVYNRSCLLYDSASQFVRELILLT